MRTSDAKVIYPWAIVTSLVPESGPIGKRSHPKRWRRWSRGGKDFLWWRQGERGDEQRGVFRYSGNTSDKGPDAWSVHVKALWPLFLPSACIHSFHFPFPITDPLHTAFSLPPVRSPFLLCHSLPPPHSLLGAPLGPRRSRSNPSRIYIIAYWVANRSHPSHIFIASEQSFLSALFCNNVPWRTLSCSI